MKSLFPILEVINNKEKIISTLLFLIVICAFLGVKYMRKAKQNETLNQESMGKIIFWVNASLLDHKNSRASMRSEN